MVAKTMKKHSKTLKKNKKNKMFNEMGGGDQRSLPPNVRELFFFVFDCFFNVFETMSLDFFYISSHEQSPVDSSTAFGLLSESFV